MSFGQCELAYYRKVVHLTKSQSENARTAYSDAVQTFYNLLYL